MTMSRFIKRLLSGAAALCLTAGLTGCVSRLPQGGTNSDAGGSSSTAASDGETAGTEAPGTDKESLARFVRKAAQNSPGAMALNAEVDVQVTMRGDWGSVGYRYQGPLLTDSREGINRLYEYREYSFWTGQGSRYSYQNQYEDYLCYYDSSWIYQNNNGKKSKEPYQYAGFLTHRTQTAAPLVVPSRLVVSAEAESAGGTHRIRLQLNPHDLGDTLGFLRDEYGDKGERAEIISLELEVLIGPDGCYRSQTLTVNANGRQTFGESAGLGSQEDVSYTAIYAASYAPQDKEVVITPPDNLDTYRIEDKDEI